MLVIAA